MVHRDVVFVVYDDTLQVYNRISILNVQTIN